MSLHSSGVLQLCGDTVGGVRRHVHSILLGATHDAPLYAYAFSSEATDQRFHDDLKALTEATSFLLPLKIRKKPALVDIQNILKLVHVVRCNNIRVVHGHGAKAGMYARLLKLFCNVSVVYTPHGGVLHNAFSKVEQLLYLTVERWLMRLTDLVVVESEYSKAMFLEKIGRPSCPLVVNYNGVAASTTGMLASVLPPFKRDTESDVHLGVFARIHPMKGVDLAIQICAELAHNAMYDQVPRKYHFHIFGGGERAELEQLAEQLVCAKFVHFHGDVIQPEAMMAYLDAVIIPSKFESFSYVAAEALMMRIPVIAAQVGGLPEVLAEKCGILVVERTAMAFATEIRSLFDEYGSKVELVNRGYARFQRLFTEERMVSYLEDLYRDLLNKSD